MLVVKNPSANAGDARDTSLIPGLGRSPGEGNGNPLHYSCLENPMDRRAWWATAHGVSSVGHDWAHTGQPQQFSTWQELSVGGGGEVLSPRVFFTLYLYCPRWRELRFAGTSWLRAQGFAGWPQSCHSKELQGVGRGAHLTSPRQEVSW